MDRPMTDAPDGGGAGPRVRTAVIPAAGLGTRFLPATKAVPKELLPIIDVPALQLVIDEAAGAGIDHVVIVSHPSKPGIEAYVTPDPAIIERLRAQGRDAVADRVARIGTDIRITIVHQLEPKGLGHAVGCARDAVGDEPFAVLLPDELMDGSALLDQMARLCEATSGSVVGLKRVPRGEVHRYGVIIPTSDVDTAGVVSIGGMVEKPANDDAPSDLIIIGRYVLTPDVFDQIASLRPGAGGELQLTDALRGQAEVSPFHGVLSDIGRHDTGNPLGWLRAVVDLALDDPDVGPPFRAWLDDRLAP